MYIDSPNISGSLNITGSILLNGTAVTASGGGGGGSGAGFPFSGSADITGSLRLNGDIHVEGGKIHGNEAYNNHLKFNTSSSLFKIQNKTYIKFDGSSNQREVTINEGTNDIDFVVKGASNNPLFKTDSATNKIGTHGAGTPSADFHIGGNLLVGTHITSSGNISGSFVGDGSGLTGINVNQFATVNDTFTNAPSHSVVHNFGTKDVFVQVFESDDTLLIPQTVTTTNTNQVDIVFGDVLSGRVVIGRAGHILQNTGNFVSSSTSVATFSNAMSASINHNLDSLNIITQVYDSNNNVIVPSNIKNTNSNQTLITFSTPRSGKAVIAKAGHIVQGTSENATSASFATTTDRVRAGSQNQRDSTVPQSGSLWFRTDTSLLEVYTGVSGSEWEVVGGQNLPPVSVDFLIVAGGGGGAYNYGGGGGAGGLRTSYGSNSGGGSSTETSLSLENGTTYNITVGGGGAGSSTDGSDGVASSIIGTGLSVSSTGGGGAASNNGTQAGHDGGSGGGGSESPSPGGPGGSGTSGQGYAGGTGYYGSGAVATGGGGGGASAAGGNGASQNPGNGGNGLSVSITGTAITYAGGGGASSNGNGGGTGGTGGGGAGTGSGTGTSGDTNKGGGGGASQQNTGASGGSGVVILRLATSKYTGSITGSPTVTTDGTDTILVFNSSGTYTA